MAFKLFELEGELSLWNYRGPEHIVASGKVFEYLVSENFVPLEFDSNLVQRLLICAVKSSSHMRCDFTKIGNLVLEF